MGRFIRIFDGIYVSQLFQTNEHGETIFYPFGLFGRGYVVPQERVESLKRSARLRTFWWVLAGTLCASVLVGANDAKMPAEGWGAMAPLAVLLIAVSLYTQIRMTAGLRPSAEHVGIGERLRRGRLSRPYWSYWVSIVCGVLCIVLGATAIGVSAFEKDALTVLAWSFLTLIGLLSAWDGVRALSEVRSSHR